MAQAVSGADYVWARLRKLLASGDQFVEIRTAAGSLEKVAVGIERLPETLPVMGLRQVSRIPTPTDHNAHRAA
jgi:hypothetical protein